MTNAELIMALRCRSNDIRECKGCAFKDACYGGTLELVAADALEEAEKRIKELESQAAFFDAEKLNYQENIEYRDERIKELEARLPKEGYWIPNSPFTGNCSECSGNGNLKDNYCPNCGAKMDGKENTDADN